MGHVHNQYLHHAMDHGVVGLLGFFALLLAMFWTSFWLYRISALAALQFGIITFIHTFVSFSYVNLARNYYAVTLSLATGWVFVQALSDRMPSRSGITQARHSFHRLALFNDPPSYRRCRLHWRQLRP